MENMSLRMWAALLLVAAFAGGAIAVAERGDTLSTPDVTGHFVNGAIIGVAIVVAVVLVIKGVRNRDS